MLSSIKLKIDSSTIAGSLFSLGLLVGSGCSTMPDCEEGGGDPVSGLFAPLDNAVGKVNQGLNDQESEEGCGMMKSSETNKTG